MTASDATPLLEVEGLTKRFPITHGILFARTVGHVHAVEDVSLAIRRGRTLGLVGESGSGKSTTGRLIVRLIDPTAGSVRLDGTDITHLAGADLRAVRRRVQLVFQDSYGALNPRQTVGQIIGAPLRVYRIPGDRATQVASLLDRVGLDPGAMSRYPHELSGGQRQRIGIARALALGPELVVLDEPVSALDVSVQAHILNLLTDLQRAGGITYLVISHDLSVIRHLADDVAVMYLGRIVEQRPAATITTPSHPYTAALVSAAPGRPGAARRPRIILTGDPPSPITPPSGCAFHPRCPKARLVSGDPHTVPDRCRAERPSLIDDGTGGRVACWYPAVPDDDLVGAAAALGALNAVSV
jgi:oligopeptide/dipeptide ABC transporter ATP-binding protein